eukprot:s90_g2.t2
MDPGTLEGLADDDGNKATRVPWRKGHSWRSLFNTIGIHEDSHWLPPNYHIAADDPPITVDTSALQWT